ncbi:MAG: DUF2795 domain-containing protein [Dehalogenimonas sp.]
MTMILDEAPCKERTSPGFTCSLDMSVSELEQSLSDVPFPASKQDLILRAENNGAREGVRTFLHLLPEGKYRRFHDIANMAWSFLLV